MADDQFHDSDHISRYPKGWSRESLTSHLYIANWGTTQQGRNHCIARRHSSRREKNTPKEA